MQDKTILKGNKFLEVVQIGSQMLQQGIYTTLVSDLISMSLHGNLAYQMMLNWKAEFDDNKRDKIVELMSELVNSSRSR